MPQTTNVEPPPDAVPQDVPTTSRPASPAVFAIVVAAGVGSRVGGNVPKQYLLLGGRTLLERAVMPLSEEARIGQVLVVVAPGDERASALRLPARVAVAAIGGPTRAHSTQAGLEWLGGRARDDDLVLVHDAARPCLAAAELAGLIDACLADAVGGLLALPMGDTVKRAAAGRAAESVDRSNLWRAGTPQMFRFGLLRRALSQAADLGQMTDEAAAVEACGERPLLVKGLATNIKVTTPEDWPLAEAILRMQGRW